ncbi:hypothetical protein CsSME_00030639 [Camellia sinensis var. sinensis]
MAPGCSTLARKCEKRASEGAREVKSWLLKQMLASHPSMTFLVMKQRYLPKTNENRCKTNVRGPKHAVRGPGNCLLNTENGIRPRSGFLRPQCPSKGIKIGCMPKKSEQTEMVRRSRTEAHGQRSRKIGNRTPKWAKWPAATKCSPWPLRDGLQDLSLPSGKETEKTESGSQTETRHRRGFGSPEAGLTVATLKLLNEHNMQHHQALNR